MVAKESVKKDGKKAPAPGEEEPDNPHGLKFPDDFDKDLKDVNIKINDVTVEVRRKCLSIAIAFRLYLCHCEGKTKITLTYGLPFLF